MDLGRKGEVILEEPLDGFYIKKGARLLGNTALLDHVKDRQRGKRKPEYLSNSVRLDRQFTKEVERSLEAIAGLSELGALFRFVYAGMGSAYLQDLVAARSRRRIR